MEIGERIKYHRKKNGYSQDELAHHLGVARQTVSKWENESMNPGAEQLVALSTLFHVSIDCLLLGKETIELENANPNSIELQVENDTIEKISKSRKRIKKTSIALLIIGCITLLFALFIVVVIAIVFNSPNQGDSTAIGFVFNLSTSAILGIAIALFVIAVLMIISSTLSLHKIKKRGNEKDESFK